MKLLWIVILFIGRVFDLLFFGLPVWLASALMVTIIYFACAFHPTGCGHLCERVDTVLRKFIRVNLSLLLWIFIIQYTIYWATFIIVYKQSCKCTLLIESFVCPPMANAWTMMIFRRITGKIVLTVFFRLPTLPIFAEASRFWGPYYHCTIWQCKLPIFHTKVAKLFRRDPLSTVCD